MSIAFWPLQAANTFSTPYRSQVSDQLSFLHNKKFLMDFWHSVSESGRERIAWCLAYTGNLFINSEFLQPLDMQSNHDARLNIVDTLLTLIFSMRQGVCYSLYCVQIQPMPHLWRSASNCHSDYSRVSKGSRLPGCSQGLEPDRMVQCGWLPRKQGYTPGSVMSSNRTAVP